MYVCVCVSIYVCVRVCECVCRGGTHLVRAAVGILAGGSQRKREIEEGEKREGWEETKRGPCVLYWGPDKFEKKETWGEREAATVASITL